MNDFIKAIKIMVNELLQQLELFADEELVEEVITAINFNQPFDIEEEE